MGKRTAAVTENKLLKVPESLRSPHLCMRQTCGTTPDSLTTPILHSSTHVALLQRRPLAPESDLWYLLRSSTANFYSGHRKRLFLACLMRLPGWLIRASPLVLGIQSALVGTSALL